MGVLNEGERLHRVKQQMSLIFLRKAEGSEQCSLCGISTRTIEVNRTNICSVRQVGEEIITMASLGSSDGCSL
jgi:hypothetical protein